MVGKGGVFGGLSSEEGTVKRVTVYTVGVDLMSI